MDGASTASLGSLKNTALLHALYTLLTAQKWFEVEGGQTEVGCQGEVVDRESGEVLEQLPREAVDAPSIPGGVQGQAGWGPGQVLNMEVGGPACGGGLELHDPSGPFQPKLLYDSMIRVNPYL